MAILKVQPACRETIWGGQRLRKDYHMQYEGANIAEAWMLSCHPSAPSMIENGTYSGKTLQQYLDAEGPQVRYLEKEYKPLCEQKGKGFGVIPMQTYGRMDGKGCMELARTAAANK